MAHTPDNPQRQNIEDALDFDLPGNNLGAQKAEAVAQHAESALNEEQLSEIHKWRETFQQEWTDSQTDEVRDSKETVKKTREEIVDLLPDSIDRIRKVIKYDPLESKRALDSSWKVIEAVLAEKGVAKAGDPLMDFLSSMPAAKKELDAKAVSDS